MLMVSKPTGQEYPGHRLPVLSHLQTALWNSGQLTDQPPPYVQNATPAWPYQQIYSTAAPSPLPSSPSRQRLWQPPYSSYYQDAFWVVYLRINVLVCTWLTSISNRVTSRAINSQDSLAILKPNILLEPTLGRSVDLLRFKL